MMPKAARISYTTRIAYIVTADYYTDDRPTTCALKIQPVNFDPAIMIDYTEYVGRHHSREIENFTRLEDALKRISEIGEASSEHILAHS